MYELPEQILCLMLGRLSLDELPDLFLLPIIQMLSLDERASLRLANKHLRDLCDSIKIKKLIVGERNRLLPGKLEHTGELYEVGDTADVADLNLFFNSPIHLLQMAEIETLVVYGERTTAVQFGTPFEHLVHLELHDLLFTDLAVIGSRKLQTLVLNRVNHIWSQMAMTEEEIRQLEQRERKPRSTLFSGLAFANSIQIKHLWLNREIDEQLLLYCIESDLLKSVERLAVPPAGNLDYLVLLGQHCPALKRIDLVQQPDYLSEAIEIRTLCTAQRALRNGLDIYVFGIQFWLLTELSIKRMLEDFVRTGWNVTLGGDLFDTLLNANQFLHLRSYFEFVEKHYTTIGQRPNELDAFRSRCKGVRLDLSELTEIAQVARMQSFLHGFSGLRKIALRTSYNFAGYSEVVEFLLLHDRLEVLEFECWNHSDFSFLFRLPRLKHLSMQSGFPIDQNFFAELLLLLERLQRVDLIFLEDLSLRQPEDRRFGEFKQMINDQAAPKGLNFAIQCYRADTCSIIRFQLTDGELTNLTMDDLSRLIGLLSFRPDLSLPGEANEDEASVMEY